MVGEDLMPARMMNSMKTMLRKCWSWSHQGKPVSTEGAAWAMPGCRLMKATTSGRSRRLCAKAIRQSSPATPAGNAQSVLTQRLPIRTRGTIPGCGAIQWSRRTLSSASVRLARSGSGATCRGSSGIGRSLSAIVTCGHVVRRRADRYVSSLPGADTTTFYTIGHSTRTIAEFVDLLRECTVDLIVDVRSIPRSRTNPQFNRDSLPASLAPWQIGYEHVAELGGLRGRTRDAVPSPNGYWQVMSFRNFADYALTPPFAAGLVRLRELGGKNRCAVMCAEVLWWRCHRRIIADYLLAAGERVVHILGPGHVELASLTTGAVIRRDGTVIYPP
jgi:hypothetical protein